MLSISIKLTHVNEKCHTKIGQSLKICHDSIFEAKENNDTQIVRNPLGFAEKITRPITCMK